MSMVTQQGTIMLDRMVAIYLHNPPAQAIAWMYARLVNRLGSPHSAKRPGLEDVKIISPILL